LASSGKPLLPSFGRYIQIPHNVDFKVSVKKGKPIEYENVNVLPAQEKIIDSREASAPEKLEYDNETYSSDELFPKEIIEVSGPFDIDGYNSLLIHVRPLQYEPAKEKIIGYSNITVTISFTGKDEDARYPFIDPEVSREVYGNFFVNPRRRIEERVIVQPKVAIPVPIQPRGPEFLIIYHKTFQKAAAKLAKWKIMRGLRTEIISIDSIGNSVAKIKNYIRKLRSNLFSRLRYVLLFGDVEMIVAETISPSPWGENITDYYYSTSKDPASSTEFVFPWLSIGRIPVKTSVEAMSIVNKIIRYERNPPCDPEYYRRMAFAAYFQDDSPQDGKADRAYLKTMEDIRIHMSTLGFDVERIYVSNNPNPLQYVNGQVVSTEVKNAIVDGNTATDMLISTTSEGQLIMGHRDHGSQNGWSHPSFTTDHLDTILSEYPSLFYSINCLTGMFDLPNPTDSFAEKLLKIKGAAPSVVAATRVSHTWLNNDLMKALFDAMWAGVLPTFPGTTASYSVRYNRVGDILNYAKTYLPIKMSGSNNYIKDHFEIYHVVGDPTLEIWKSLPRTLQISAKVRFHHLYLQLSACPRGSILTIWHGNKLLKRIEPTSTNIKLPLREFVVPPIPPTRKKIIICFWAPRHRFQSIKVN